MHPWLPDLLLFEDKDPHAAALNMAIDEVLLAVIACPILRVYGWAVPAVSFGYFERWEPVRESHPGRDAVRRWTGGGVVLHGEDFTYSLLIPRGCDAAGFQPAGSYGIIHGALCSALADMGIAAGPSSGSAAKISQVCFENPVEHDVLVQGQKVAGAAQRRTRAGLMHQGSIQTVDLPKGFGASFASRLADVVRVGSYDVMLAAEKLAAEKYGTRGWLEKRL